MKDSRLVKSNRKVLSTCSQTRTSEGTIGLRHMHGQEDQIETTANISHPFLNNSLQRPLPLRSSHMHFGLIFSSIDDSQEFRSIDMQHKSVDRGISFKWQY
jgi:hypothetical protein